MHTGEHRYSSTYFLTFWLDRGECSTLHPTSFTLGKTPWIRGWVGPSANLDVLEKNKSLIPAGIQTLDCPGYSLVTIPNTLSKYPLGSMQNTKVEMLNSVRYIQHNSKEQNEAKCHGTWVMFSELCGTCEDAHWKNSKRKYVLL